MNLSLEKPLRWITGYPIDRTGRWLYYGWAAVLLIIGGLVWGLFFNWGREPFVYHDWVEVTAPRIAFLQNAVDQGLLPLHVSNSAALGGTTDRFMSVPDVLISPQILLLRWLSLGNFLMINLWLLYAVGFAGLVWLCRRKRISMIGLSILFFLLNFNGFILSHLAVGHYTWTAFLLLPWLLGLILEYHDTRVGWGWVLRFDILTLVILLQGGYHLFIYTLVMLAFIALLGGRNFWRALQALVTVVLVSAVRLLPLFIEIGNFKDKTSYYGGFGNLTILWKSLVESFSPNVNAPELGLSELISSWELNFYIGLVAALFLLSFGVILTFKNRKQVISYVPLLLPIAGLTTLSLERVFRYVRLVLPLPIFTGERVSARFLGLAFALLAVLAVVELQRWLDEHKPTLVYVLSGLCLLTMLTHDIWQNLLNWTLPATAVGFSNMQFSDFNPSDWTIANHPDNQYSTLLVIGAIISLITMAVLTTLTILEKRHLNLTQSDHPEK